jgi:acetylornithine deacetylase/succinyl-diaminopimelate desuccinylase-like protein
MFRALEHAQAAVFPGTATLPVLLTGATDSAELRVKGVQAYGLGSVVTDRERGAVHGNDERLSVDGLGQVVQLIYAAVTEVAARR